MSKSKEIEIKKLSLDLKNFRTTPQINEDDAINAMISIKPERFYAVMESIIDDGYLPTENILVLKDGSTNVVREGNRRIAAMKLIHGLVDLKNFPVPASIKDKIAKIDKAWKTANNSVPCSVYESTEAATVERIVALSHAKGEKASRDPWSSVARARYDRDTKGISSTALDILEKYLHDGKNLTGQQKDRWAGEFPLTVLDEAIRKLYARLGYASATELASNYPKILHITEFEDIIRDIGVELLETREIRNTDNGYDFAARYNIPPIAPPKPTNPAPGTPPPTNNSGTPSPNSGNATPGNTSNNAGGNNIPSPGTPNPSPMPMPNPTPPPPPKSYAINDPKNVAALLKKFAPKGTDRQKVVSLRDELRKLKITDNPIAFCLLLRSIFEISAKVYCDQNSISLTKVNGTKTIDKTLIELLREITKQLTSNSTNPGMNKVLHGAITEMGQPNRILSVTSMNQLVHNPSFSVLPSDICTVFGNIYPLLEAMN